MTEIFQPDGVAYLYLRSNVLNPGLPAEQFALHSLGVQAVYNC